MYLPQMQKQTPLRGINDELKKIDRLLAALPDGTKDSGYMLWPVQIHQALGVLDL